MIGGGQVAARPGQWHEWTGDPLTLGSARRVGLPVTAPKSADLIAAQIRRQIVQGILNEGDALPPPVRAALKAIGVKAGRFGSYVNHGKINATIQKGTDPASLSLENAIELLKAKAAGGGVIGRLVGEHPDGGPVTVRDGRYGAYVNWGKVNATISKGSTPDSITLSDALELIAEREGKPVARPRKSAKRAPARGKPQPAKAVAADSAKARAKSATAKKAAAKKAAPAKPKSAAGKRG